MGAGGSIEIFEEGEVENELKKSETITSSTATSSWELFKAGYDNILHTIIRPPRHVYRIEDLGPIEFEQETAQADCPSNITRHDFTLLNDMKLQLHCSVWDTSDHGMTKCVLYLHGLSGSRVEALPLLGPVLKMGYALAALDFAGSGKSDGKYISMGYHEKADISTMLRALHQWNGGQFTNVCLWGRSMGANAALLLLNECHFVRQIQNVSMNTQEVQFCIESKSGPIDTFVVDSVTDKQMGIQEGDVLTQLHDKTIKTMSTSTILSTIANNATLDFGVSRLSCQRHLMNANTKSFIEWVVLDSSFTDMETTLYEMVQVAQQDGLHIPNFLVGAGIALVRSSIRRMANFDLLAVKPIDKIHYSQIPIVFVHGLQDDIVLPKHSEENYNAYQGKWKEYFPIHGCHDSARSRVVLESICTKLYYYLHEDVQSMDYDMLRRQLFPDTLVYPTWSIGRKLQQHWNKNESIEKISCRIAPFSACAIGRKETKDANKKNFTTYRIAVFAPPSYVYDNDDESTCFGNKEKEVEVREETTTTASEANEVKSLWQTFVKQKPVTSPTSRLKAMRVKSPKRAWLFSKFRSQHAAADETYFQSVEDHHNCETEHNNYNNNQRQEKRSVDEGTEFEITRRFHDIKLFLTKLSNASGGLPNELQVIRSKLMYSTKVGVHRLEERQELLDSLLQTLCSTPILWNNHSTLEFLCLKEI